MGTGSTAFAKKIAFRYLWSKRREAFISIISIISVLGVAIGVMVLTIVMAVMTGFEYELREKIVGTDSHVVVSRIGGRIENWQAVRRTIESLEGVQNVSPFSYNQVLIKSETRSTGVLIRGILPDTSSTKQLESYLEGTNSMDALFNPDPLPNDVELPGIIIGRQLANALVLFTGQPITVLSPQVSSTPLGLAPKFRRFVVSGIYSSGLIEYESSVAYVSLEEAQAFFGLGDVVTGFEVRVNSIDDAPEIAMAISKKLQDYGQGFTATDWKVSNAPLWSAIQLEKKVYFIVLLLIIIMASFSIITTLIMIVLEKRKDIAVMKTMGATTKTISQIFILQGTIIGAVGTVAGLILGLVGCLALKRYGFPIDPRVFQMSSLPIRIEWVNFIAVGISAFLICCLATIYPARRASLLEPNEALRYE